MQRDPGEGRAQPPHRLCDLVSGRMVPSPQGHAGRQPHQGGSDARCQRGSVLRPPLTSGHTRAHPTTPKASTALTGTHRGVSGSSTSRVAPKSNLSCRCRDRTDVPASRAYPLLPARALSSGWAGAASHPAHRKPVRAWGQAGGPGQGSNSRAVQARSHRPTQTRPTESSGSRRWKQCKATTLLCR